MSFSQDHPVYIRLRTAIFSGEIAPGTHLKINELSRLCKTSTAPLREALVRLATEDILHYNFSHGYTVRNISISELSDTLRLLHLIINNSLRIQGGLSASFTKLLENCEEADFEISSIWSHKCSLGMIISRIIFTPVEERKLQKLAILLEPFEIGIKNIDRSEYLAHEMNREFITALKVGEFLLTTQILKNYFDIRIKTLPLLYQEYETNLRCLVR